MKFRYQDQSISIHYRNLFTGEARELVWDLTDYGCMARLDREWQARKTEVWQQLCDRDLAEAHAFWHEMQADGVNVDTRAVDERYAELAARTRADDWVAKRAQRPAECGSVTGPGASMHTDGPHSAPGFQPDSADDVEPDV